MSDEFDYSVEADFSDHPMGPDIHLRENIAYHNYYGTRALEKGDLEGATKHAKAALNNSEELVRKNHTRYKRGEIGREDMRKKLSYHVRNQGDYHKAMGEIHLKAAQDSSNRYSKLYHSAREEPNREDTMRSLRKEALEHAEKAERHLFAARDKYIKVRKRGHLDIGRKISEVNDILEDFSRLRR